MTGALPPPAAPPTPRPPRDAEVSLAFEGPDTGWRFRPAWRRLRSAGFDVNRNSTARRLVPVDLWGRKVDIYANANLSIYSAERCNAACAFCVEELRPLSRGAALTRPARCPPERWLARLDQSLVALRTLGPSVAVTGGEPSRDPLLPDIAALLARHRVHKRSLTTNASGLWWLRGGRPVLHHLADAGLHHLNISRAHPQAARNAELMAMRDGLDDPDLTRAVAFAQEAGISVRLSCVLLQEGIGDLAGVDGYLDFARKLGVRQVIFRQLMRPDPATTRPVGVARYAARQRVDMETVLRALDTRSDARLVRQVMGYYYYVEVWQLGRGRDAVTVCFESADLAHVEAEKRAHPERVHELVFHPTGTLCSTWQAWDGQLGPPGAVAP